MATIWEPLNRMDARNWQFLRYSTRNDLAILREIAQAKNRPCMDCMGWFDPCQMDFDHRPGTVKRFNVSQGRLKGLAAVREELAKCDVVCANCHRLRTWKRSHE